MPNINNFWMSSFNNNMMKLMDIFNMAISNIIVTLSVFLMIFLMFIMKNNKSMILMEEVNELEMFWTIMPTLIILLIASPSLFMLYYYEENKFPFLDVKVFGNQWYWTYEYLMNEKLEMYINASELMRNLHTNISMIIPSNKMIRLMISSNDVIHSWTIPSLMTKMDAIPGRLNMTFMQVNKSILMKGQCSEICGVNHSFMPISVMSLKI